MKKLFTLVAVAGMFTFVACGPSAEQKAAAEKAKQDSIAAVEAAKAAAEEAAKAQAIADSTTAYADAEAAKAKAAADSVAAAEANKKGGKKK